MTSRYGSLAVFLLLAVLAAAAGASFEAGEWYFVKAVKPSWAPPVWLIAPAWAIAYVCAALAAWKVWMSEHYDRLGAMAWWLTLLALNVFWSFLFFGLHRPGWAWPVLVLAIVLAIVCTLKFKQLSGAAAGLMMPYLAWIAFLCALNLAIWTVNGGILARVLL